MTDKINNKTNIVERRHAYNKIVNVKNATELKKKNPQGNMSPQQIKQLLESLNNEEKKTQKKLNKKKAKGSKTKQEKDW